MPLTPHVIDTKKSLQCHSVAFKGLAKTSMAFRELIHVSSDLTSWLGLVSWARGPRLQDAAACRGAGEGCLQVAAAALQCSAGPAGEGQWRCGSGKRHVVMNAPALGLPLQGKVDMGVFRCPKPSPQSKFSITSPSHRNIKYSKWLMHGVLNISK